MYRLVMPCWGLKNVGIVLQKKCPKNKNYFKAFAKDIS